MKHRLWLTELYNLLYNRLGGLAIDIPTDKRNIATPMVPLADIKQVLEEELDF